MLKNRNYNSSGHSRCSRTEIKTVLSWSRTEIKTVLGILDAQEKKKQFLVGQEQKLKGQCHEIFDFNFFALIKPI